MRFRFLICTIFLFLGNSYSQDLKITEIDNSSFPTIRLTFELNETISIGDLKLLENGKDVPFVIDSADKKQTLKTIFYLIDISRFKQKETQIVLDALLGAVTMLGSGSQINIGYIPNQLEEKCFVPLSYEFTEDGPGLIQFIRSEGLLYKDDGNKTNDIACALLEALGFVHEKKLLHGRKTIIIISKDIKDIGLVNRHLEAGTNKYGIEIKYVSSVLDNYIVEPANFYSLPRVFKQKEVQEKLNQAAQDNNLTNLQKADSYTLEFTGSQNDFLNYFELQYFGNTVKASYIKPGKKPYKMLWFVLIIFALLIVLVFFIRKQVLLKKQLASLKETVSLLFDKRVKILGKQTLNPVIEVQLADKTTNFHIKKLSTTLGRGKDCDLKIEDLTISSHHASITNEGGEFYIRDNESTNGVFVNDIKVEKSIIKNGDIIRLGKAILMIHY